jgi:hypothetical protein
MRRGERWAFNIASLAVAASGLAYFWMKYLARTDDPFALVNHPWQPAMLHLHVLSAPALILVFGIILNSHIMKKLGLSGISNRTSGLISFGTFAIMVCSGYLLQVATNERWLRALVAVHVASGVSFTATYTVHLVANARLARRRSLATPVRDVA